ncbi:hypothetical protein ANTPLA_LOCUS6501 [Anthophora plagiata]
MTKYTVCGERDILRSGEPSIPVYVCTNRSLRAGRRHRCRCTSSCACIPPTREPFLVDVWVEDTHGRRKQRIMVITVIKRRPLRTRPGCSWKIRPFTQCSRKPWICSRLNCQANFASSQFMLTCPDVLAIFPSSPNWHVMLDCIILQNFLHTAELLCTREITRR